MRPDKPTIYQQVIAKDASFAPAYAGLASAYAAVKNSRYLGYAYGRAGRREEAEKLALAAAPNAYFQALIYVGIPAKLNAGSERKPNGIPG
jgi:hypothetical protein